jgi:hypothetical protein
MCCVYIGRKAPNPGQRQSQPSTPFLSTGSETSVLPLSPLGFRFFFRRFSRKECVSLTAVISGLTDCPFVSTLWPSNMRFWGTYHQPALDTTIPALARDWMNPRMIRGATSPQRSGNGADISTVSTFSALRKLQLATGI